MSEHKHTPGPWLLTECTVYALNDDSTNRFYAGVQGGFIYQTSNFTVPTPGYEIISNARLMCVAPQLLEALIGVTNYLDDIDQSIKSAELIEVAREAIAAATGES